MPKTGGRAVSWTYNEFRKQCAHPPAEQRLGQWAFNLLYSLKPELADQVRTTDRDPFYRDQRLEEFFAYVAIHWEDS